MIGFQYRFTGVSGVTRLLTRFDKWVTAELPELTKNEANEGSKLLVQLMPHESGGMAQAVSIEPSRNTWAIVSRTPKGQRAGNLRPYHIWYNEGKRGWYKGATKTGEFHYYETTAKYLNNEYPKRVMNDLKKVIGGV